MTSRTLAPLLAALVALSALGLSCLKGEKVDPVPDNCVCDGVVCINGTVNRRAPRPDNGEGDNPCLGCDYQPLGICTDGCTDETFGVQGCPIAYACKTWDRVKVGANCAVDRDCEPGAPANTLACRDAACVDVGALKWEGLEPTSCSQASFGASAQCASRACLGEDEYATSFWCAAARCIENSDCPKGWHCRCAEEYVGSTVRGWRWCIPDEPPKADAGAPAPDAGS